MHALKSGTITLKNTSIHEVIIVVLFLFNLSISIFILMAINLTQNHSICPKEYRGKKIKVKNRPDFFACDIGGGV